MALGYEDGKGGSHADQIQTRTRGALLCTHRRHGHRVARTCSPRERTRRSDVISLAVESPYSWAWGTLALAAYRDVSSEINETLARTKRELTALMEGAT